MRISQGMLLAGLAALGAGSLPLTEIHQATRPVAKRFGGPRKASRNARRKDEREAKAFKLKGIRP
jgi:hypothetical protein